CHACPLCDSLDYDPCCHKQSRSDCRHDHPASPDTPCPDDTLSCTADHCDGAGACAHVPMDHRCDDGDPLTDDICGDGPSPTGCRHVPCGDRNPCTDDLFDPTDPTADSLGCVHRPNSEACDDNDACTIDDRCSAGSCSGRLRT